MFVKRDGAGISTEKSRPTSSRYANDLFRFFHRVSLTITARGVCRELLCSEVGKVCRRNSIERPRAEDARALEFAGCTLQGTGTGIEQPEVAQQRGKCAARDVYHTLLPLLASLIVRPSVLFPVLIRTAPSLAAIPRPVIIPERCANEAGTLSFSVSLSNPRRIKCSQRRYLPPICIGGRFVCARGDDKDACERRAKIRGEDSVKYEGTYPLSAFDYKSNTQ